MQNNLRIVLFGSGEVTARCLVHLIERGTTVTGLVISSNEDNVSEELLTLAEVEGIRTLAPKKLRSAEFLDLLRNDLRPDVILSIAYQHHIPREVLDMPRWGALNWHPSLLPSHRGPDPYFWALYEGDREAGVTVHYMTEEFDAGEIILQPRLPILSHDTWGTLARRLDVLALETLNDIMNMMENAPGDLPRRSQPSALDTYQSRPRPEDFNINWFDKAQTIVNLVHACNPNFGARTRFRDNIIFIFKATIFPVSRDLQDQREQGLSKAVPGEIVDRDAVGIYVQTGSELVRLEIVQSNGDYLLSGADFAFMERTQIGERLEEIDPVSTIF